MRAGVVVMFVLTVFITARCRCHSYLACVAASGVLLFLVRVAAGMPKKLSKPDCQRRPSRKGRSTRKSDAPDTPGNSDDDDDWSCPPDDYRSEQSGVACAGHGGQQLRSVS